MKVELTFLDLILGFLSAVFFVFAFAALKLDWPSLQLFLFIALFCALPIVAFLFGTWRRRDGA